MTILLAGIVLFASCAFARSDVARVVIRRGGDAKTNSVTVVNGRIHLPRQTIGRADAVLVTPSFATAFRGEDGYFVLPDGLLGRFDGNQGEVVATAARNPMPLWCMKTPRRTFSVRIDGMPWDCDVRVRCDNGRYELSMAFDCGGDCPEEDIDLCITDFPQEADYPDMARHYRNYRFSRGEVRPIAERLAEQPLLSNAVEAVEVRIRQAWKPAPSPVEEQTVSNEPPLHVAATFDRAVEFVRACKRAGVRAAEFCLVGWNRKGHDGRYPDIFPVEPELGGDAGLRRFVRETQKCGYLAVCHNNHSDAYSIASRWNVDDIVILRDGGLSKNLSYSAGRMYDLCPQVSWRRFVKDDLRAISSFGFRGLHYIDVLSIVPPRRCFSTEHRLTRRQSAALVNRMLSEARCVFGGSASEGGFDFCAGSLDSALYVYFGSPDDPLPPLIVRRVPFWQLVYHGIVLSNPFGRSWNAQVSSAKCRLSVIEFGGRTTFYVNSKFYGKDLGALPDLRIDSSENILIAVDAVRRGEEEYGQLADLQFCFMDDHRWLAPNVVKTTYSNGDSVYVNYGESECVVGDIAIPAQGFVRRHAAGEAAAGKDRKSPPFVGVMR